MTTTPTKDQFAVYTKLVERQRYGIYLSREEDADAARHIARHLGVRLTDAEIEEIMDALGHV